MFNWIKNLFKQKDKIKDKVDNLVNVAKEASEIVNELSSFLNCTKEEIVSKIKELKALVQVLKAQNEELKANEFLGYVIGHKDEIVELVNLLKQTRFELKDNIEKVVIPDINRLKELLSILKLS